MIQMIFTGNAKKTSKRIRLNFPISVLIQLYTRVEKLCDEKDQKMFLPLDLRQKWRFLENLSKEIEF